MKSRFILFLRAGIYYYEDTSTKEQFSLRTKDHAEALRLLDAKNESHRQPTLNRQIAHTYLAATDPEAAKRTSAGPNGRDDEVQNRLYPHPARSGHGR